MHKRFIAALLIGVITSQSLPALAAELLAPESGTQSEPATAPLSNVDKVLQDINTLADQSSDSDAPYTWGEMWKDAKQSLSLTTEMYRLRYWKGTEGLKLVAHFFNYTLTFMAELYCRSYIGTFKEPTVYHIGDYFDYVKTLSSKELGDHYNKEFDALNLKSTCQPSPDNDDDKATFTVTHSTTGQVLPTDQIIKQSISKSEFRYHTAQTMNGKLLPDSGLIKSFVTFQSPLYRTNPKSWLWGLFSLRPRSPIAQPAAPLPNDPGFRSRFLYSIASVTPTLSRMVSPYLINFFIPEDHQQRLNAYQRLLVSVDNTEEKANLRSYITPTLRLLFTLAGGGTEAFINSGIPAGGPAEALATQLYYASAFARSPIQFKGIFHYLVLGMWDNYDYSKWRSSGTLLKNSIVLAIGSTLMGFAGQFLGDWLTNYFNYEPKKQTAANDATPELDQQAIKRTTALQQGLEALLKGHLAKAEEICKQNGVNPVELFMIYTHLVEERARQQSQGFGLPTDM